MNHVNCLFAASETSSSSVSLGLYIYFTDYVSLIPELDSHGHKDVDVRVKNTLTLIAEISGPALPTNALERVDEVHAGTAVQAGITSAVVDVLMAVNSRVARVADALASAAGTPARTGRALAAAAKTVIQQAELGRGFRAVLALPLGRAVAVVVSLGVEALGRVAAGIGTAVVPVDLALVAGVAYRADALVRVDEVAALAAVLAGLRGALVDVELAVLARVAGRAGAVVVVDEVDAERVVLALAHAVVDVARAVLASEPAAALAPESFKVRMLNNLNNFDLSMYGYHTSCRR